MPKLAVVQTDCVVGSVPQNLRHGLELVEQAAEKGADLACLPECFNTGLADNLDDIAEPIPDTTSDALCEAAAEHKMWIVAGLAEKVETGVANTALVINPDGAIVTQYHKCFLYMQENEVFEAGAERVVVDLDFATAGVMICYDYIFPEYVRALVDDGARLIIHPTAWVNTDMCDSWHYPAREAYRAQCMVRALENNVFFMSANHGGASYDPRGYLRPVGGSSIIAPWGEVLAEVDTGPGVAVAEVDFEDREEWVQSAAPYYEDYCKIPIPPRVQ